MKTNTTLRSSASLRSTRAMVLYCLIGAVVLLMGYGYSSAKLSRGSRDGPKADESGLRQGLSPLAKPLAKLGRPDEAVAKIGVVNIRRVFRDCRRNARYSAGALAEQARWDAEQEKLRKEIDSQKAGLKALKPGSSDYLAQIKELLQKQARLEASRQFNNQQRALKDQRWTEDIYMEILKIIRELAEQKRLDLVFQKDVPPLPAASPEELMLTLNTHKLLYSGGCLDITDEVIARLDAEQKN